MAKKDKFDIFLEKQFGSAKPLSIASPVGGERATSYEERRRLAEEEKGRGVSSPAGTAPGQGSAAPQQEEARKPGRPKGPKKELAPLNFFIDKELKTKLELLKIELYRSSVTDLVKEALHDLLVKYGKE